jgi:hypothetical protein
MGLLKKAKGFVKKTVRKVVPKEVAGIMQVAAPFVAPYSLPGALALSLGGQLRQGQGRISPFKTLLAIAPSEQFRGFTRGLPGGASLDRALYGAPSGAGVASFRATQDVGTGLGGPTQGLFGVGGEFGLKQFMGGSLLSPGGKLSKARVAGLVAAGATLATTKQEIEEEGEEAGLSSSEIARLQAEAEEMWQDFDTTAFRPRVAEGGLMRTNLAMGSKPTAQESGLGGLPIEADMRYTGGFMPYGAKEKADDVPARLSKNEFVFTADAVRAAGGGDINMGARRMYNTMKQLESMGRA